MIFMAALYFHFVPEEFMFVHPCSHEYQMIMSVIWKRINDTGKNWRHVYKALTILEYLASHGSERVIDEIRVHIYQISTLSDFQHIDSSRRDSEAVSERNPKVSWLW